MAKRSSPRTPRATARAAAATVDSPLPGAAPLAAAVAVAVAVLVYVPALGNGFIWDDPLVLQQLRAIRAWGDLVVMPPQIPAYYYRPLVFVSYLVDRGLGGETPFWFHLSVIALHALNCFLVFRVAAYVFADDVLIAGAGAVLFAVFPTHVESVAWMAGRSDVIACTFLLLTVLLCVRREAAWTAWAAGAAFFLALLSKEMAITGLLLVPALDWLSRRRVYWQRCVPLLLAAIAYAALRRGSVGGFVGGAATSGAPLDLALDVLRAVGFYVVQSLAPLRLCAYVPTVPDGVIYLAAGVLVPLAVAGVLYRWWGEARWPLAFLVAWFALTLAPSLTVILRRSASAPVADRYLYVPSVASCMLLAWAVVWLTRRRRLPARWPLAIVGVLSAVLGIRAATYARVWSDNYTFWSDVTAKVTPDALAQQQLSLALLDRGQLDDAERSLRQTLALPASAEERAIAYSSLGSIYRRSGRVADAVDAFQSALRIAPHPALYHNLGMALMAKAEADQRLGDSAAVADDVRQARSAFETALTFSDAPGAQPFLQQWDPAKTHALLGQVLNSLGDRAGARQHLETALRLEPTGPIADVTRRYLEQLHP